MISAKVYSPSALTGQPARYVDSHPQLRAAASGSGGI